MQEVLRVCSRHWWWFARRRFFFSFVQSFRSFQNCCKQSRFFLRVGMFRSISCLRFSIGTTAQSAGTQEEILEGLSLGFFLFCKQNMSVRKALPGTFPLMPSDPPLVARLSFAFNDALLSVISESPVGFFSSLPRLTDNVGCSALQRGLITTLWVKPYFSLASW